MAGEPQKLSDVRFSEFVNWGFQGLIVAVGVWGVSELSRLSSSVQELNVKMAVVVERDATRSEQVRKLEDRVNVLEQMEGKKGTK